MQRFRRSLIKTKAKTEKPSLIPYVSGRGEKWEWKIEMPGYLVSLRNESIWKCASPPRSMFGWGI